MIKVRNNLAETLFGFLVKIGDGDSGSEYGIIGVLCGKVRCRFRREIL